jgi:hypothetical protein
MTVCFCTAHAVSQQDVWNKKTIFNLYVNMWTPHVNKKKYPKSCK